MAGLSGCALMRRLALAGVALALAGAAARSIPAETAEDADVSAVTSPPALAAATVVSSDIAKVGDIFLVTLSNPTGSPLRRDLGQRAVVQTHQRQGPSQPDVVHESGDSEQGDFAGARRTVTQVLMYASWASLSLLGFGFIRIRSNPAGAPALAMQSAPAATMRRPVPRHRR